MNAPPAGGAKRTQSRRGASGSPLLAAAVSVVLLLGLGACGQQAHGTSPRPRAVDRRRLTESGRRRRKEAKHRHRRTPGQRHSPTRGKRRSRTPPHAIPAYVVRVIDGDTIVASFGGRTEDVRLIGIDTPETVDPRRPVQCFGKAASRFTTEQLEAEHVRLEFDVERTDRYGRALAYVWKDGRLFNETIVRRGYASVYTFPPNVKYVERFVTAQRAARRHNRGLWRACGDGGGQSNVTAGGARHCDPNYRGACIPAYPPDVDCPDVSARNFESVGTDPHNFDYDGDGIACET